MYKLISLTLVCDFFLKFIFLLKYLFHQEMFVLNLFKVRNSVKSFGMI